ncbi:transglutaminase family protein [Chitinophaga ginsengisegetis]|uniref:transglutaminase family protein n=1 Tax=Chitinophaga ginsengisegetis TaxID=393003 RepID=UPI000DB9F282|nr:transglutaminase family protein [Chitinophaga ginsengisegetis]MDR6568962.1 transglutaminase-like putative cysteine protease [Chitinophaga ginsengisegetis]MDR6649009.1 transglutaminase-like putative cysteine protease [Chitinophaga ginsengisegetis]MDR6655043.1 transglutaminase-like putative cysteine protease [Chitinophaga ginsengisegetis]
MPVFKIKHITHYTYETPVRDSANQIILYPVKDEYQKVIKHDLSISRHPEVEIFKDYYGNEVGIFTQTEPHHELKIFSAIVVETIPRPLPADTLPPATQWQMLEDIRYDVAFIDYLKHEVFESVASLRQISLDLKEDIDTPFKTAVRFCDYVFTHFDYIKGVTTVDSTLDEILLLQAGVCQDFAHLLTAMLRFTQIPARYVSGYICPNKNGMRGEGATHAWAEVYIPEYGWLGLDPTNNCIAGENHVKLAVGRNFSDCSPVKGVYSGGAGHTLDVTVSVGYDDQDQFDPEPFFPAQPAMSSTVPAAPAKNSYQRHLEEMMIQQQQQQQ